VVNEAAVKQTVLQTLTAFDHVVKYGQVPSAEVVARQIIYTY
jgi:hypothetical protein